MTEDNIRERLARVEQRFEFFEFRQNAMVEKQDVMAGQLSEMFFAFKTGKERAWVYMGVFSAIVGLVSANARWIWAALTGKSM